MFTCKNANVVSYKRLRAYLRAGLIKTQNVFAHKIFQHSNALWVQKLSGCTICKAHSLLKMILNVELLYKRGCSRTKLHQFF